ncbi:unnamed protein product, partial [Scytosiphon promiscuus]
RTTSTHCWLPANVGYVASIYWQSSRESGAVSYSAISDKHSVLANQRMSGLDGRGNMTLFLLPRSWSASVIAALFLASTTCTNATSTGAALGSDISYREPRRLEAPRSDRARSVCSTNGNRSARMIPAFTSAATAGGWTPRLSQSRDGASDTTTRATNSISPRIRSGLNRKRARPRMDFGELDGIMQTTLSPTSEPTSTGMSLDPAQEDVVHLDLDTPAILLTAGAGTGKTHTLAARLARILGVEPRRPVELNVDGRSGGIAAGAEVDDERPDQPHIFEGGGFIVGSGGGGAGGQRANRVGAHAAAPESVLVLSFTNQGAQDVRERAIAVGVPRAHADRVWAATFHSFAATVLKQNRQLLWSDYPDTDSGSDSSPVGASHAPGLDIIGHPEQIDLVARLLADRDTEDRDTRADNYLAAPFYGSKGVFEGSWSAVGDGGSWGMPPTAEERGKEAARRRRESETRAKTVLSRICLWKEQGITVEENGNRNMGLDGYTDKAAASVYASYQHQLYLRRQVDFGDLCMMTTELFTKHPEVLERYRWRFRHVLVDEYQDTSPAQQRLLKALVLGLPSTRSFTPGSNVGMAQPLTGAGDALEGHPGLGVSLFCAGDEDQHIYGWRGTTTDHLHRFEEDFPGAVRCALAQTHRLPVHLLRSATGLMRAGGLVPLLNRRMRTKQHTPGAVVRAQGLWNSREEGKWVAMEACKMNREQGISYSDMAVIARTAYNTRELEESLAARGIPYTVEGGSSFFSRPEVQAPLALLALCANPQDDAAFRRGVSLRSHTRLLGWATPSAMRTVGELAVSEGVSYAEGVRLSVSRGQVDGEDATKFIYGLRRWSSLLMGWPKLHETERGAAVWRIFWEAGFLPRPVDASFASQGGVGGPVGSSKMTKEEETVVQLTTAASRCDHIGRFLLRATRAREETASQQAAKKGRGGRGGRWEGSTGTGKQQSPPRPSSSEDSLEMMTMHQAKGKEFKVVFLTGWDEGSFPLLPNSGDGEHVVESLERLDEERRLGYVALTRARENAIITFSKKRRFRNNWVNSAGPSRFLLEMPTEYVEVLPDAIGRALNDYPGLAGSHRLAFDGMIQAGKLRRSRPVLPSASEARGLDESHQEAEVANTADLPPGCTIVDRNPCRSIVEVDVKSVKKHAKTGPTARPTVGDDARRAKKGSVAALLGAGDGDGENCAVENVLGGTRGTGTRTSSVLDNTAAAFPQAVPTGPLQQMSDVSGSTETPDERPPTVVPDSKSKSSRLREAWASAGALLKSVASVGGMGEKDVSRRVKGKRRVTAETPATEMATSARTGKAGVHTKIPRQQVAQNTPPLAMPSRYNPGPTFRKSRGRKRKAVLDPSGITADDVVGPEQLIALLEDTAIQQASLKNYLRAVLAIQHGCVRGSIPVWRSNGGGGKPSKAGDTNSGKAGLRRALPESEATGRAAISICSAQDLVSYIIGLLEKTS